MNAWFDGRRAARASEEVAAACDPDGTNSPTKVGIEHEFLVRTETGEPVDFRSVIHDLRLGRRDLVATYAYSYRMASGSIVTADQTEAEIATPPATFGPGMPWLLDAWAAWERRRLADRISPMTLRGDSTHVNISLPADVDPDLVANLFATRFALGMMLLMDRRHSPGLIVRPRPYRLELGGEYAVGSALRATVAYATGATLACVDAARTGDLGGLPEALEVRLERHVLRFGWYVARTAFGDCDLYCDGRSSAVHTANGGRTTGGMVLRRSWATARASCGGLASDDLADADDLVSGVSEIPIERRPDDMEFEVAPPERPQSAYGSGVRDRHRTTFELASVMSNWELAVFLAVRKDRSRSAFIAVPGPRLDRFLTILDAGGLDSTIERYLATAPTGRRLTRRNQVERVGIYDALGLRASLLAPERDYWGSPFEMMASRATVADRRPVTNRLTVPA